MNGLSSLDISTPPSKGGRSGKGKIVLFLALLVIGSGACAYFLFYDESVPPPEPIKKTSAQQAERKPAIAPSKTGGADVPKAHQEILVPQSGNLGTLTELIALREEKKLHKEIANLEKQITELIAKPVTVTVPPADTPPAVPAKDSLIEAREKDEAENKRTKERRRTSASRIQSIQGVNGALSAKVVTAGEIITLRKGSVWIGGTVTSITRQGIALEKNGKQVFIPYANGEQVYE